MRKISAILLALLILQGCGVCRHFQPKEETNVKDSLVLHIKDSLAIKWVPVEVPVPVEVMREIVPAEDSSHLETSVAESVAYIDSTGRLHHSLQNKPGASIQTTVPVEEMDADLSYRYPSTLSRSRRLTRRSIMRAPSNTFRESSHGGRPSGSGVARSSGPCWPDPCWLSSDGCSSERDKYQSF